MEQLQLPILPREDREVLLAAVRVDDDALQWASTDLLADRGVVLEAVRRQMGPDPTESNFIFLVVALNRS